MKIVKNAILSTAVLASLLLGDDFGLEAKVEQFARNMLHPFEVRNENFKVKSVEVSGTTTVPGADWFTGYVVKYTTEDKDKNGIIKVSTRSDILFLSSEGIVATGLFTLDGRSLTSMAIPKIDPSIFYTEKNLILGNGKSENKILIFSDPWCPYCRTAYAEIEKKITQEKKDYAVYLYHFPIGKFPSSKTVSAIMAQAHRKGIDITSSIYNAGVLKVKSSLVSSNDVDFIASEIEKISGYSADKEELYKIDLPEIDKEIEAGLSLAVNSTPKIFINGVLGRTKDIK
ncbi:MAG: thioredoxin fold domain-containing protein [Epsilonproteobacteria bacterium]|nr:thioredoxin fold domain-containing protein [Campylobacterota bacterium]